MELPDIIELNHFGGNIDSYIDHLYDEVYIKSFYEHRIYFRGKPVLARAEPKEGGREYSFLHSTSNGKNEANREYDLRRSERLHWVKPMIEGADVSTDVIVWQNVRRKKVKRKTRKSIHTNLFHTKECFLISLHEEKHCWRFISCYHVYPEYKKNVYIREHGEFMKTGVPVEKK